MSHHHTVYRLVTRDSIEQGILERAVSKRKLELMTITRKGFKAHQKEQVCSKDTSSKDTSSKDTSSKHTSSKHTSSKDTSSKVELMTITRKGFKAHQQEQVCYHIPKLN